MKLRYIFIFTAILLSVIYICWKIYQDSLSLRPKVIPINKSEIVQNNTTNTLKYYYEPKPNVTVTVRLDGSNSDIVNTINKDNLNEQYEYSVTKSNRIFRIITIGDSFTYGQDVNTSQNYSEILEGRLNNNLQCPAYDHFEVINLGVNGYDIEYSIERLLTKGLKYSPDLTIWLLNSWNFYRINELMVPLVERLESEGIPNLNTETGNYDAASAAFSEIHKTYGDTYILNYQKKLLDRLSQNYNAQLLILKSPGFGDAINDLLENFIQTRSDFYFSVDLSRDIFNKENQLFDGHPNTKGHEAIAQVIFETLKQSDLSACVMQ